MPELDEDLPGVGPERAARAALLPALGEAYFEAGRLDEAARVLDQAVAGAAGARARVELSIAFIADRLLACLLKHALAMPVPGGLHAAIEQQPARMTAVIWAESGERDTRHAFIHSVMNGGTR